MFKEFLFLSLFVLLDVISVTAAEPPSEPPAGTIKADVGFPVVGTKWIGRIVLQNGPTATLTYTVIEDGAYEGKPVHRVVVGNDTNLYDIATSNAVATLRFGKEATSTLPHDGTFSWPLYVNKSWTATFTFNNRVQGMTVGPLNVQYRVTAFEDVTVPAGTWKAFKIESETSNNAFSTIWYAPEIHLMVKRINETTVGHPSGRTKTEYEVIEYTPAKKDPRSTGLSLSAPTTGAKAERPEWQVGYHWRYAWTGPAGKGIFTQEIVGEDSFEDTPVWVMRMGKNENLVDKNVLGLLAIRAGERLISKSDSPYQLLSWPLEISKQWKISHIVERVEEKSSQSIDVRVIVASYEDVKVPAGSFEAFKIEAHNNFTGMIASEH
jgi:hypothetical protein